MDDSPYYLEEDFDWLDYQAIYLSGMDIWIKTKNGTIDLVYYKEKKIHKFKSRKKENTFYSKDEIEAYSYGKGVIAFS